MALYAKNKAEAECAVQLLPVRRVEPEHHRAKHMPMKSPAVKTAVLTACLCVMAGQALAISRHDPTRTSCDRVHAAIASEGAVILRYPSPRNPSLTLYDRYVASARFCNGGEVLDRAFVPSADARACPVFKCKVHEPHDRFRRFLRP
ncbi:hypothetical protein [Manganibacter manganicus]